MSADSHFEIYLHIIWHTKNNAPTLMDDVRSAVHAFLVTRAQSEKGVLVHAIGGTDDHVHLAASVPPTLTLSKWIGELKGASSHYVNHRVRNRKGALDWQAGYSVKSFGAGDLQRVVDYIENQPAHHEEKRAAQRRERYEGPLAANRRRP